MVRGIRAEWHAPVIGGARAGGKRVMLHTDRLTLRPFEQRDLVRLHTLWTDPEVRRYLWDDEVISLERAEQAIRASERAALKLGMGLYCVFRRHEDDLIGFAGFRCFEGDDGPELLYGFLPDVWGQGFATEACRVLLSRGFGVHGFQRVVAATDTPNQSSVRVLQRLGMVFRERRPFHGLDTVFYELGAAEFSPAVVDA